MNGDLQGLIDIFEFGWFCFNVPFELFGFEITWFGLIVALFILALPFIIIWKLVEV